MNPYETDKLLHEYLLFHYGTGEDVLGDRPGPREALHFAERCVTELLDLSLVPENATALDIGCAVGRSSFTLARTCRKVIGLDYSQRFVDAATELKNTGFADGEKIEEGDRRSPFRAKIAEDIERSRVSFEHGDATDLRADLPPADVVLAANLICRLPTPQRFLDRLPSLVRPGGQLLLTTPFTWMEEFTPRENWLSGEDGDSFAALQRILEPSFVLQKTLDLPFLIREHSRKFQYTIALGSRWIRR